MQNLSGKNSIMGRAVSITTADGSLYCCVIGQDMAPMVEAPPMETHSHNQGGWGGYPSYPSYGGYKAPKRGQYYPQQFGGW